MSKQQLQDFTTWVYRALITGLLSVTLFFCKSTYNDFQTVKQEQTALRVEWAKLNTQVAFNKSEIVDLKQAVKQLYEKDSKP